MIGVNAVSAEVARLLEHHRAQFRQYADADIVLAQVVSTDKKNQPYSEGRYLDIFSKKEIINDKLTDSAVDIVVDLACINSQDDNAQKKVTAALDRGQHYVTANSFLLACFGKALSMQAVEKKRCISFNGAMDSEMFSSSTLMGETLKCVTGMMDLIGHLVLVNMEEHACTFEKALNDVVRAGYIESACHYIEQARLQVYRFASMAATLFCCDVADVVFNPSSIFGIDELSCDDFYWAQQFNYVLRPLLTATRVKEGKLIVKARMAMVPSTFSLRQGDKIGTALFVNTTVGGDYQVINYFENASQYHHQTARGIVEAIIAVSQGDEKVHRSCRWQVKSYDDDRFLADASVLMDRLASDNKAAFYLKIHAEDHPGVLASIAKVLCREGVELDTLQQKAYCRDNDGCVDIAITTQPIAEMALLHTIEILKSQAPGMRNITFIPIIRPDH